MRRAALALLVLAAALAAGWRAGRPGPAPPAEPTDEARARQDFLRAADDLARGHFLAGRPPRDWDETTRGRHRVPHLARVAGTLLAPVAELKWKRYLSALSAWLALLEDGVGRPTAPRPADPEVLALLQQHAYFLAGHLLIDYKTLQEVATNALKYPAWEIGEAPRAEAAPGIKRTWTSMKAEGEVFLAHRLRTPDPATPLLRLEGRLAGMLRTSQADRVLGRLVGRIVRDPGDPFAFAFFDLAADLLEGTEDGAVLPCARRGVHLDALLPFAREPPGTLGPAAAVRTAGMLLRESVRLALLCGRDTGPGDFARIDTLLDRVPHLAPSGDLRELLKGTLGLLQDEGYAISGDGAMAGLGPRIDRLRALARAGSQALTP